MRLLEAIGFCGFVVAVGAAWLSLCLDGWIERRRRPRPYNYEIDGE